MVYAQDAVTITYLTVILTICSSSLSPPTRIKTIDSIAGSSCIFGAQKVLQSVVALHMEVEGSHIRCIWRKDGESTFVCRDTLHATGQKSWR